MKRHTTVLGQLRHIIHTAPQRVFDLLSEFILLYYLFFNSVSFGVLSIRVSTRKLSIKFSII